VLPRFTHFRARGLRDQVGTHQIEISVSDGTATTTQNVTIIVGKDVPFTTLPLGNVGVGGIASVPTTVSGPASPYWPLGQQVEPVYSPSTVSCRASGTNPGKVTIYCSARVVDYVVTPTAAGATLTQTSYDTGASGSVDHDGWFGV
jgi:hypothetical protein